MFQLRYPSRREVLRLGGIVTAGAALGFNGRLCAQSDLTVPNPLPRVSTFSIVAYNPDNQYWAVAVTSKVLAVGSIVPFVGVNVRQVAAGQRLIGGALANQSFPDFQAGLRGIDMLKEGASASTVMESIIDIQSLPAPLDDQVREQVGLEGEWRAIRQIGLVDVWGRTAVHTGAECGEWAGHIEGTNFTVQGNLLTGESVVSAVADFYENSADQPFSLRLVRSLQAGQAQGGDRRRAAETGYNSAAIRIAGIVPSYGLNDRVLDLRVDNDPAPLDRLIELIESLPAAP